MPLSSPEDRINHTISKMCSWVSFILLVGLCYSLNEVSGARHHYSAAILTGTVYCDTCFPQQVPKSTISGATVVVECGRDGVKPRFREEVKTNEKGEFEAKLPAYVGKRIDKVKECSVKLISSSQPYCAVAATATSSDIHFKSKKAGAHVFSAGFFTFKPQSCNQKNVVNQDLPPLPVLPPVAGGMLPPLPVPDIPIPPVVPTLPQLPGVPPPPNTRQKASKSNNLSDQKTFGFPFPPNPFQPPTLPPLPFVPSPPSLVPPLPFTPSPPSLFPPIFPSPPPASLFPPVPSLIPSPPPPPPPAFPIPLPPFPTLPPFPGVPPVPPASRP